MDEPEKIDEAEAAAEYRREIEEAGQARLFPVLILEEPEHEMVD